MQTVVGSFDGFDEAKRAARELMDQGFRERDVSVVASSIQSGYGSGTGTSSATTGIAGPDPAIEAAAAADASFGEGPVTTDGGGLADLPAQRCEALPDDASATAAGAVTGGVVGGAAGLAASLIGLAIPGIGPVIAAGPIVALLSGAGVGAVAGGLIGGLTDMGVARPDAERDAESVRRGGALVAVRADAARSKRAAQIMREHGAVDIERRAGRWRERGWTGFGPIP
ncbi:MAG TPA: hypothetical protein VF059_11750 [Casimicrobiaceae bacterium]